MPYYQDYDEALLKLPTWGMLWLLLAETYAQAKASRGRLALRDLERDLRETLLCSAARDDEGKQVGFLYSDFWEDVTLQEEPGGVRLVKTSDPHFDRRALQVFVLRRDLDKYYPKPAGAAPMLTVVPAVISLNPEDPNIPAAWKVIRQFVAKEYPNGIGDVATSVIMERALEDPEVRKKLHKSVHRSTFARALGRKPK